MRRSPNFAPSRFRARVARSLSSSSLKRGGGYFSALVQLHHNHSSRGRTVICAACQPGRPAAGTRGSSSWPKERTNAPSTSRRTPSSNHDPTMGRWRYGQRRRTNRKTPPLSARPAPQTKPPPSISGREGVGWGARPGRSFRRLSVHSLSIEGKGEGEGRWADDNLRGTSTRSQVKSRAASLFLDAAGARRLTHIFTLSPWAVCFRLLRRHFLRDVVLAGGSEASGSLALPFCGGMSMEFLGAGWGLHWLGVRAGVGA